MRRGGGLRERRGENEEKEDEEAKIMKRLKKAKNRKTKESEVECVYEGGMKGINTWKKMREEEKRGKRQIKKDRKMMMTTKT